MKLDLITYGCGHNFDMAKFNPIRNRDFFKPDGGLWSSPVNSSYGWWHWCKQENFGDLSTYFKFQFSGNVFIVDSYADAMSMPWVDFHGLSIFPDYEKLLSIHYDAIWLTQRGERETRFSNPALWGWDCESVLIMNPLGIQAKPVGQENTRERYDKTNNYQGICK